MRKLFDRFRYSRYGSPANWAWYNLQATTPATPWKKWLLGAFLALAALFGVWKLGVDHGTQAGIDAYHNMCALYGGIVVDNTTGLVVQCKGVGVVPQQELKKNFQTEA